MHRCSVRCSALNSSPSQSLRIRFQRAFIELCQVFGKRSKRHRSLNGNQRAEFLEPRALLAFSPGNVVVLGVPSTTSSAGRAAAVTLFEYPPTANAPSTNTILVPSGTGGLTDVPADRSGFLNLSSDGQYIVLMGSEATAGSNLSNTTIRSIYRYGVDGTGRQIARLSGSSYSTTFSPNGATSFGGAPNAAATYWTASPVNGTNTTVRFFDYNGTATFTGTTVGMPGTTTRNVAAFRNVLFAGSQAAVSYFPNPKDSTVSPIALSGVSLSNGSGSFLLLDRSPTVGMNALNGLDTLFAIDGAAIRKFEYNGDGITNSWIARGSATFSTNLFAVSGRFTGNSVSLVATTDVSSENSVVSISDTSGFNGNLTGAATNFTTLYSAGANFRFKGVQFAPTAPDTTAPTVDIAENDADNVVIVNTPVQYTLTFNEPIQTDNIVSSFFENAGTSAVTIGTPSFPNATTVTFNVTPTSVGTLQLRIKSTAGIRDLATNSLVVPFSDNDTLNVVLANQSPTDITLSNASIPENSAADTTIGFFTATDINPGDTHTFTLVAGTSSTDNASFTIVGNQLRASNPFNFETKPSYSIRVRATDAGSLTFEKTFTISVTNVNETPADITLSSTSIAENQSAPAVVGNFSAVDPDSGDSHTFTLVAGTGDTDNASFSIVAGQLRSATTFNFETKSSYSIRVQAADAGNLTFQKVFTISVTNINDAPVNAVMSSQSVAELLDPGALVGTLSATDEDAGDTVTWTLVTGDGSTDNANFTLVGNQVRTAATFDFETKATHTIRVEGRDSANATVVTVFTISITNVTEINSIDVQLGQTQRSFVRYVDMTFDRSEDIQALLSSPGRFRLLRADLNGANFVAHTPPAFALTAVAPRTIRIDFGAQGIGGNRNSNIGDGYYELGFDTNGDGSFTSAFDGRKRFYRLLGDVTGDGKVTTADSDAIYLGFGSTNPERDANGDGVVNSNDRTLAQRAIGRKLLDSLFATGLDD